MEGGHSKEKAREIKRKILEDYTESIKEYEDTTNAIKVRIRTEEARLRLLEYQLESYFGIKKKYEFRT